MTKIVDRRNVAFGGTNRRNVSQITTIVRHCDGVNGGTIQGHERYWRNSLGWRSAGGYAEFIGRDGTVYINYNPNVITNGVGGHNSYTYHISLAGIDSFTAAQEKAFMERVLFNMNRFNVPVSRVRGHREFPGVNKLCPGVNMNSMRTAISRRTPLGGSSTVSASSGNSSSSTQGKTSYSDAEVKRAQIMLMELGYSLPKFGADGKWGSETASQIGAFQIKHGISNANGKFFRTLGPATMAKLVDLYEDKNIPAPPSNPSSEVTSSDNSLKGKRVRITHDSLNYRNQASFDDSAIAGKVSKGDVFTIQRKVKVSGSDTELYELISGTYITAHPAYSEIVGENNSSPKPQSNSKPASKSRLPKPSPTVRNGSRGSNVRTLQNALNALNFNVGSADGIAGSRTVDGIRRWQSVHTPREVDGIAGQNTMRTIGRELDRRNL